MLRPNESTNDLQTQSAERRDTSTIDSKNYRLYQRANSMITMCGS